VRAPLRHDLMDLAPHGSRRCPRGEQCLLSVGLGEAEVEVAVHLEAEGAVWVDVGPEQRCQGPAVLVSEPVGPLGAGEAQRSLRFDDPRRWPPLLPVIRSTDRNLTQAPARVIRSIPPVRLRRMSILRSQPKARTLGFELRWHDVPATVSPHPNMGISIYQWQCVPHAHPFRDPIESRNESALWSPAPTWHRTHRRLVAVRGRHASIRGRRSWDIERLPLRIGVQPRGC
jgi:hypothetical protein